MSGLAPAPEGAAGGRSDPRMGMRLALAPQIRCPRPLRPGWGWRSVSDRCGSCGPRPAAGLGAGGVPPRAARHHPAPPAPPPTHPHPTPPLPPTPAPSLPVHFRCGQDADVPPGRGRRVRRRGGAPRAGGRGRPRLRGRPHDSFPPGGGGGGGGDGALCQVRGGRHFGGRQPRAESGCPGGRPGHACDGGAEDVLGGCPAGGRPQGRPQRGWGLPVSQQCQAGMKGNGLMAFWFCVD